MLLLDEPMAGMAQADIERISALIKTVARNHQVLGVNAALDRLFEIRA